MSLAVNSCIEFFLFWSSFFLVSRKEKSLGISLVLDYAVLSFMRATAKQK